MELDSWEWWTWCCEKQPQYLQGGYLKDMSNLSSGGTLSALSLEGRGTPAHQMYSLAVPILEDTWQKRSGLSIWPSCICLQRWRHDWDEGSPDTTPDEALETKSGTLSRESSLPVHQCGKDNNAPSTQQFFLTSWLLLIHTTYCHIITVVVLVCFHTIHTIHTISLLLFYYMKIKLF